MYIYIYNYVNILYIIYISQIIHTIYICDCTLHMQRRAVAYIPKQSPPNASPIGQPSFMDHQSFPDFVFLDHVELVTTTG